MSEKVLPVLLLTEDERVWLHNAAAECGMMTDGDFIWYNNTKQGKWLSHVHVFEVNENTIRGQLTIRNRQSDAGGIDFNSGTITKEKIREEVIKKFGNDEAGRGERDDVVCGLKDLIDDLINYWERN